MVLVMMGISVVPGLKPYRRSEKRQLARGGMRVASAPCVCKASYRRKSITMPGRWSWASTAA